jgi:hypothetical protein
MPGVNSRHEPFGSHSKWFCSTLQIDLYFMKKLTFTIVCALAVTGAAFAQGTVAWNIISPAAMTAQTNMSQFSPVFGGGYNPFGSVGDTAAAASGLTYYFELLYNTSFTGSQVAAPDFATLFGGTWLDTGLTATNALNFAGWLVPVNPTTHAVVPWDNGTTNNIMLVGWSANLGTSWLAVSNVLANWDTYGAGIVLGPAFFGESAMGYLNPFPSGTNPGEQVFGAAANANGLPINNATSPMQLYILGVPEPGTVALAGLGGLSLLLFRRRE